MQWFILLMVLCMCCLIILLLFWLWLVRCWCRVFWFGGRMKIDWVLGISWCICWVFCQLILRIRLRFLVRVFLIQCCEVLQRLLKILVCLRNLLCLSMVRNFLWLVKWQLILFILFGCMLWVVWEMDMWILGVVLSRVFIRLVLLVLEGVEMMYRVLDMRCFWCFVWVGKRLGGGVCWLFDVLDLFVYLFDQDFEVDCCLG